MKLPAACFFKPGDVFHLFQSLQHLLILLDWENHRDGLSLLCDDLRLGDGGFHTMSILQFVAWKVRFGETPKPTPETGALPIRINLRALFDELFCFLF